MKDNLNPTHMYERPTYGWLQPTDNRPPTVHCNSDVCWYLTLIISTWYGLLDISDQALRQDAWVNADFLNADKKIQHPDETQLTNIYSVAYFLKRIPSVGYYVLQNTLNMPQSPRHSTWPIIPNIKIPSIIIHIWYICFVLHVWFYHIWSGIWRTHFMFKMRISKRVPWSHFL